MSLFGVGYFDCDTIEEFITKTHLMKYHTLYGHIWCLNGLEQVLLQRYKIALKHVCKKYLEDEMFARSKELFF